MATMYPNSLIVSELSELVLPDKTTNNSAKIGVNPNLAAVICSDDVPSRAYLEKAVDTPQAAAAPTANRAAIAVPEPVAKLTLIFGNVTK